jgi:hypothetical protein
MLDPWVIDWIHRREREQQERNRLPLELPLPLPPLPRPDDKEPDSPRGVVIIDLL